LPTRRAPPAGRNGQRPRESRHRSRFHDTVDGFRLGDDIEQVGFGAPAEQNLLDLRAVTAQKVEQCPVVVGGRPAQTTVEGRLEGPQRHDIDAALAELADCVPTQRSAVPFASVFGRCRNRAKPANLALVAVDVRIEHVELADPDESITVEQAAWLAEGWRPLAVRVDLWPALGCERVPEKRPERVASRLGNRAKFGHVSLLRLLRKEIRPVLRRCPRSLRSRCRHASGTARRRW
jgi:hypothetical protein